VIETGTRPLLFLDVDGPLIPFGGAAHPTFAHPAFAHPVAIDAEAGVKIPAQPGPRDLLPAASHPLLARIDPAHGPRLAALPCDLVWATTWADDANRMVGPRAGLPALAVVAWPEPAPGGDQAIRDGVHWKTGALISWAAGRPFAWVDDEITAADRDWVAAHHPGPALLHRVDPLFGLTDDDYATLRTWLTTLEQ
jgi:hypothetical protein